MTDEIEAAGTEAAGTGAESGAEDEATATAVRVIHGVRVGFEPADGPPISTGADGSDLVGNAWYHQTELIAVPIARLAPAFFDLSTGIAGDILQKIVNYRLRIVIFGDVTTFTAASDALDAFVWESNRGDHVWFLADEGELETKLAARAAAGSDSG